MSDVQLTFPLVSNQQPAIEQFFKGNASLYHAFKASALKQFEYDIEAAETAIKNSDDAALRRTAHNLKSALRMLGFESQAQLALKLELAAASGDQLAIGVSWHGLGTDLRRLIAPAPH